ncbi:PilW family protein [Vibrio olivae]
MKLGAPRGFTLVEMVATIVVSSILILGIAGFIELGTTGYVDSVERGRLQTQAKFLLER